MTDQLKALTARLLAFVQSFRAGNPQTFKVLVAALALAAVICGGLYWLNPGAPVIIAGNLAPADRTALALRLRRHQIDFKLGSDSITVPSGEVAAAQQMLASGSSFAGGGEDFSLFDRATMGQSDFDEQVNYQRSLQGELERTIMDIHGVDSARVMLAMGHPSPFALGVSEAARASVLLTTTPGAQIDAVMARAIAHLVAGSVRGLTAANVVITGNDGALLYPPQHDGEYGEAVRVRDDLEHRLQAKIAALLDRIMGENRFAAEVAVTIETSHVTSRDQVYGGKGDQAVLSEEHSVTPAAAVVGGIPGLTSNLPTPTPAPSPSPAARATPAPATPAAKAAGAVAQSVTQSNDSDAARKDIVNYKPSSREVSTVTAPIRIGRITVAVVLDGTYDGGHFKPLPAERLAAIKELLAAAVGAEAGRGDSIDVQSAALSQPYVPPVPDPLIQIRSYFNNPVHLYAAAGAALMVIVLLIWLVKRMLGRLFGRRRADRGETVAEAAVAGEAPAAADASLEPPAPAPVSEFAEVQARLNEEVGRDPQAAAAVLRRWLAATDGRNAERNGHLLQ